MTTRHVLDLDDLSPAELARILELVAEPAKPVLAGRTVGLYFEKPSLRTRHSTESAVVELGGHPVTFAPDEVGIGRREPLSDVARVLGGFHAAVGARVFDHELVSEWAAGSSVPVVNLLSDRAHPCQALADLLTMAEHFGALDGLTAAWIGDFNNVARSLALGCGLSGVRLHVCSPVGYGPTPTDLDLLVGHGANIEVFDEPRQAATEVDAVHTDVFTSMGQESEGVARRAAFEGFQVDSSVMAAASDHAVFMHCLPAHRGEEVSAEVADGPQSLIIEQAHNRRHSVRGLFRWLGEVGAL